MPDLQSRFDAALNAVHKGGGLGLAVSGGGDSIAMLHLAHDWARRADEAIRIAVVDHGLRPESAAEAEGVSRAAAALGHPATILRWADWSGSGNVQAAARDARYRLIGEWARGLGITAVALGHTLEDQAETVLMRLARGSGVDGLSGMSARRGAESIAWLRPMLGLRRNDLRSWLRAERIGWVDDPSNDDPRYDRVRMRGALDELAKLGITAEKLARTADHMRDARSALDHATADLAAKSARWGLCGELRIDLGPLRAAPIEIVRRLIRAALTRVSGGTYGPRADAEAKLIVAMMGLRLGGGRSLHGCLIRPDGPAGVVLVREASALDQTGVTIDRAGQMWDRRFRLVAKAPASDARLAPLGGAGAAELSALDRKGLWEPPQGWCAAPRSAQLSTPALWRGNALLAAPVAGYGAGLTAKLAFSNDNWVHPPHESA